MVALKIKVTNIKCNDPQDPRKDELYFITAVNQKCIVSQTIRGIKRGACLDLDEVIFDSYVEKDTPIIITCMEQRGLKDNTLTADLLTNLADKGLKIAKSKLKMANSDSNDIWKQVGEYLLSNAVSIIKVMFRDTPLMTKVITEPYSEDIEYPITYVMKGKSDERPTYDYEILLSIEMEKKND